MPSSRIGVPTPQVIRAIAGLMTVALPMRGSFRFNGIVIRDDVHYDWVTYPMRIFSLVEKVDSLIDSDPRKIASKALLPSSEHRQFRTEGPKSSHRNKK